jgi:tetratricopeptide (TPR) repeat protein
MSVPGGHKVCGIMGRMENPNLDETLPNRINEDSDATKKIDLGATLPIQIEPEPGFDATIPPPPDIPGEIPQPEAQQPAVRGLRFPSIKLVSILGLIGLVFIGAVSALAGYRSGIQDRLDAESTQVAVRVQEQFELGVTDLANKDYYRARQRFEYVVQLDPGYPGVTEQLAKALMELNTTATPTLVPSPTLTPTPDLRGVQEMLTQAQQALANSDWNAVIDTALNLRKADPNFQAVQVDDLLYAALLNRGKDRILKNGDLEGGIYDLTLAERFGPIDSESAALKNFSQLYITGATFWELDWGQAVYYFGQVAPATPNLRDGSGYTATDRYRIALINFGDHLANSKQWCDAMKQYELALGMGAGDQQIQATFASAAQKCTGVSPEATAEAPPAATEEVPVSTEAPPTP